MSDVRNLHDRGSEPGKMFLGGLSWNTTDDTLKKYFSRYGRLTDCVVIRDGHGRPRGFGFVTFADPSNCEKVLADSPHFIDDRQIDPKLAIPREDCEEPPVQSIETFRTKKLFIGGVPLDADEKKLRKCFEPYGVIKEAFLMYNRDTGEPRGFGFISFDSEETVEYLLAKSELTFEIDGRRLEIKKALPKQSELLARRSELDYYSPHGPVLRQKSEDIDRGRGYRHWDPRERDKDRGRERSREARKERADEKKRGGGIGRERRRGYEPVHDYERDYGRERGSRRSRSLDRVHTL
ncbi:RNA-binding protein Musashi homolog 2-like isoform X2 [Zophobas morio]|uniref:RNA-binding protein Musashi homolog 2-like isoform X2 n=1 Tax=Zophobas morio TaxID=2755281 RepID=UPI003083DA25